MSQRNITLEDLRRYAIARSLFRPTTLLRAVARLGFVQADPIRAPARAQDLTLRHRVKGYLAGDLERRYARLGIEEDYFVNYGFLPREHSNLMHPRAERRPWDAKTRARARAIEAYVRARGPTHPRDVQNEFDLGRTVNGWGGSSQTTTHLLDGMHYRGILRVARREQGQRIYEVAAREEDDRGPDERANALLSILLAKYAPLPARSFRQLCSHLRLGAPQLRAEIERARRAAHEKERVPSVEIGGVRWFWPEGESPGAAQFVLDDEVRLLAPFDPIVWDRLRFELFFGWAYRFEAYTPAPKRKLGYYALPLLWRGDVRGWANLGVEEGRLRASCGFLEGHAPRDPAFAAALAAELARMATFLGASPP